MWTLIRAAVAEYFRPVVWLYNRLRWAGIASWRIVYADGVSYPLCYDDARTRAKLYDGRVVWGRDWKGDLLPSEHFFPQSTVPRV